MIPQFYSYDPSWRDQNDRIVELIGRVGLMEEQARSVLELRRSNQIWAVHASTAIEGNTLSRDATQAIAEGKPIFGPTREVLENQNALAAYAALETFDPWNVEDFLHAHAILMGGLVKEAGAFRGVDVEIVNPHGQVLHTGSRFSKVPRLIAELLQWGSSSQDHPLIVSSAVHYLIEHIHPFRDGNGRIGRLWQTLILTKWRRVFLGVPIESLIHQNQTGYYQALQASHEDEIDAAPFITFMLTTIELTLRLYENQIVKELRNDNSFDDTNDDVNDDVNLRLIALLRENPALSAKVLAAELGVSTRTAQRRRNQLRDSGRIRHVGAAKSGYWKVID